MENLQNAVASALGEETTSEVQTQEVQNTEPETTTVETPQEPTTETPTTNNNVNKDNATIRQMREQIANEKRERQKAQELLQRIADEKGIEVSKLEEELQAKADQRKANQLNVSPEIATQMRMQEQRIRELEEQNTRIDFNNRVDRLQQEQGLTENQVLEFLQNAQAKGFNPLTKGMDLNVLYKAMNFEKISKAKEASLRQQILNEMQQQREKGNTVVSVKPAPQNTQEVESPDDFMKSLLSKFNK